jgi:uncharacterized RDD family membrane protein YckC
MTNPYAPPRATVLDIADPNASVVPADRGTRLVATILDGMVIAVMVYMPFMVAAIMVGAIGRATGIGNNVGPLFLAIGSLGIVGFIVWCWLTIKYVRSNGQTIGKKILGIKVVRTDGSAISLGRIFWLRNVVNGLISIIPLYGIIDALFIFGESRQCVHDKIADTFVVKA